MGLLLSAPRPVAPRSIGWRTSGDEESQRPEEQGKPPPPENVSDQEDIDDGDSVVAVEKPARPLSAGKRAELELFRAQLGEKRELRRRLIEQKSAEMRELRRQLDEQRLENGRLREAIEANSNDPKKTNDVKPQAEVELSAESDRLLNELQAQVHALQDKNRQLRCEMAECHSNNAVCAEELALLARENAELKKHVQSLKDVQRVSREMLDIRECQLKQLKDKLAEIEKTLEDRETRILSQDLRSEYERQLENIRNLRTLYEERARLAEATRLNLVRDLEQQKSLTEFQEKKCSDLESRVDELEKEISDKNDILGSKENQLGLSKAEARDLQAEMGVINQLFSQLLLGFNNNQDLDKLVVKLEENHDLLTDMVVREDCSEVSSALPKLILDLLNQVDNPEQNNTENSVNATETGNSSAKSLTSAEEIVGNLPKVWRVLMELLSHQSGPPLIISEITDKSTNSCYNSVETPHGTRLVPSVSKTYIRLKDLILEKKSLQKEMNRLKQLNGHLENRLSDQERRLGLVSSELNKTWHIVGRMQRQHQQLHTQEQILRFELQQKRILLTELKEELQFCKENWDKAKQKNSESQEEWNKLRLEFSNRKIESTESVNNSAESGYSDERPSEEDSDDASSEKKTERKRIKKKSKLTESVVSDSENNPLVNNNNSDCEMTSESPEKVDGSGEDLQDIAGCSTETNERVSPESAVDSVAETSTPAKPTYDEVLAARSARLRKLEEQCAVLVHKVTKTNTKGVQLCNRLEELHNQYSRSEDEPGTSSQSSNTCNNTSTSDKLEIDIPNLVDIGEEGESSSRDTDCDTIVDHSLNTAQKDDEPNNENEETENAAPSTSSGKFDYEARFAARDARLKRMEEQAKSLVTKVTNTSTRSVEISSKLTELHNTYGRSETADDQIADDSSNSNTDCNNTEQIEQANEESIHEDVGESKETEEPEGDVEKM